MCSVLGDLVLSLSFVIFFFVLPLSFYPSLSFFPPFLSFSLPPSLYIPLPSSPSPSLLTLSPLSLPSPSPSHRKQRGFPHGEGGEGGEGRGGREGYQASPQADAVPGARCCRFSCCCCLGLSVAIVDSRFCCCLGGPQPATAKSSRLNGRLRGRRGWPDA